MKIKRFLAPSMREALKAVRTEQGPEAVILSNRKVGDYVEVIAALDYDEALIQQAVKRSGPSETQVAPPVPEPATERPEVADELVEEDEVHVLLSEKARQGEVTNRRSEQTLITELDLPATPGIHELREQLTMLGDLLHEQVCGDRWTSRSNTDPLATQLLRNLTRLGVGSDIAKMLQERVAASEAGIRHPWRDAVDALSDGLITAAPDLLDHGGIAAFVGPTGVGKTTTIAKLASQYALRHGARDIALVSMDGYRIGAREQLFTFGRIINASVFEVESPIALRRLLDGLDAYRLVLIDTAGISQRDARLAEMLDGLSNQSRPVDLYLTLAATGDEQLLDEIVRCYQQVSVKAAAITKIDEASRLGAPLSVLLRHQLPLAYIANGQCVPDDLSAADGRKLWLINQALSYAKAPEFEPDEQQLARLFGEKELVNG
ncbi:MAG: flagellar biosynthesis protein FlhF [Pseudomonadota bacterium]